MKNKYKAIEVKETGIICDNESCDYTVSEDVVQFYGIETYIDHGCPKCKENLLTVSDFKEFLRTRKVIKVINNIFFPFLFLFGGKKDTKLMSYHHHNGKTTIKDED